jgi:aryl sulfotransferase
VTAVSPTSPAAWPRKTRELHNHHFDSTVWNDFAFRDDDIVIATYAKCGTTWTQQIVGQLLFGGAADVPVNGLSPWLDLRVPPAAEKLALLDAQTHRRFVKTHANAEFYAVINDTPGRVGPALEPPPNDVRRYFLDWLERDGHPFWPFWENVRSWWAIRDLPNLMLVHFADLKADPEREIRRIAEFLAVPIYPERWPVILEHCSFEWMKAHADLSAPLGGSVWDGGASTFINRGTNGRWRDVLTFEDVVRYEATAERELGAECARWLAHGARGR